MYQVCSSPQPVSLASSVHQFQTLSSHLSLQKTQEDFVMADVTEQPLKAATRTKFLPVRL